MKEVAPKGGWKMGIHSFSVLVVWFVDGNVRTMFSIDWKYRHARKRSKKLGMERFHRLVQRYGAKAVVVYISENDHSIPYKRTLLEYYREGILQKLTPFQLRCYHNRIKARQHKGERKHFIPKQVRP